MPLNNFKRAAHFVKNAVYGRAPGETTDAALLAQRIYHHPAYKLVYTGFTILAMLLAIWEPPVVVKSSRTLAGVRGLDFLYLFVVAADIAVQTVYHGYRHAMTRGWLRAKALTWLALLVNLLIVVASPPGSVPYIARILRPLLCVERLRNVRKIAGNIARTGTKILNVGVLVVLHILVFGVLGFVLFAGIDDGVCIPFRSSATPYCSTFSDLGCHNYFGSLGESMMHLFELLTAANFPNVMMPAFRCNTANALFFIVFLVIGVYLLLNLTLAVSYASFRDLMREEVMLKYARMFAGCDAAFAEIATSKATGRAPGLSLKRGDFVTFFNSLRPDIGREAAGLLFDTFDGTASEEIDKREFRRIVLNFYRLKLKPVKAGGGSSPSGSPSKGPETPAPALWTPVSLSSSSTQGQQQSVDVAAAPTSTAASILFSHRRGSNIGEVDVAEEEEEEEVEVLDIALQEETSMSKADVAQCAAEAGVIGEAGGVVQNPLAGATGAVPDPSVPSAPPLGDRSSRVNLMRGATSGDEPENGHVASWGALHGPGSASPRSVRVPGHNIPFLTRIVENSHDAFYRAFSTTTSTDGYGLDPSRSGGGGKAGRAQRMLPKGIVPGSFRSRLLLVLRSTLATAFFDFVVLLNSAAVLAQLGLENDEPGSLDAPAVVYLRAIQYAMLAIFLLEVGVKVVVWGLREYWRESVFNRLDLALVAASLSGTVLEAAGVVTRSESAAVAFLRFLRLIRAFRVLPGFGLTLSSFGDVLPVLARYAALLLASLYAFALVGMEAFAGTINADNPAVVASSYGESNLYALNFDSLGTTFVSLLFLLVVNDWPILMEAAVAGTGKLAARGYFIAFWAVNNVLVLNVVVAFLIEAFLAEKTKRETLVKLEQEMAPAYNGKDHGVDDWRAIILHAPCAPRFRSYHLSKARHHLDIYDQLYREDVRSAFPDTFGPVRGARNQER